MPLYMSLHFERLNLFDNSFWIRMYYFLSFFKKLFVLFIIFVSRYSLEQFYMIITYIHIMTLYYFYM